MFNLSLVALLLFCLGLNAMDHPAAKDTAHVYQFVTRNASGKAAVAFYASKRFSVTEQLPEYAKNSKVINNCVIRKEDIDRALFHAAHEMVVTQNVKQAATSSGISVALSAVWNTLDRMGISQYIKTDSNLLNALTYGFIHSACAYVVEEKLKS